MAQVALVSGLSHEGEYGSSYGCARESESGESQYRCAMGVRGSNQRGTGSGYQFGN